MYHVYVYYYEEECIANFDKLSDCFLNLFWFKNE